MLKILNRAARIKSYNADDSEPDPDSQASQTDGSVDSKLSSKADTLCMPKREGGYMFNLVKDIFCNGFGVLLWINLAFWAFIGFVRGYNEDDTVETGIIYLILCGIAGMLINIVFGGFVATVISIERNTAKSRKPEE
ncbi:MAG: hypothetical protein LBC59_08110 [Chitinispirillales bacterium]|nr:hypothetical protein [Chitinispirillales bacterium]